MLNEEAQLERCLSSVTEQSYPTIIEVAVADGGSTDGTPSAASKFRTKVVRRRQPEAHPPCRPEHCQGSRLLHANSACGLTLRTALAPDYVQHSYVVSAGEPLGAATSSVGRCATRLIRRTPARRRGGDDLQPRSRACGLPAGRWLAALFRHGLSGSSGQGKRYPRDRRLRRMVRWP